MGWFTGDHQMRNILEYPVTIDEKIDAVRRAMTEASKTEAVGDIAPYALSLVLEDLEAQKARETQDVTL
jgi:hypothetical protein